MLAYKEMIPFRFAIILLLNSAVNGLAQPADCDLRKDKDGVKVYACKSDTTKFRSLRAEFSLDSISFEELEQILFDVPNYVNWQYNVIEAEVLEKIGDDQMIYRLVIHAPWPVQNREMIVRIAVLHESDNRLSFTMDTIPYDYPQDDKLVRVPYSQGSWRVVKNDNQLNVLYELNINPGGYVPAFLVNMAIAEGPYHSFSTLKRQIKNSRN